MPSHARPAGSPPAWGRDALRRAAVFVLLLSGTLTIGTTVVVRVLVPPPEDQTVTARLDRAAGSPAIDPQQLRNELVHGDRLERALQSLRLGRPQERSVMAAAIAVRLNVSPSYRDGAPGCRVSLTTMPGLAARQAAALLDKLLEQHADQQHDALVAVAQERERQASQRVTAAKERLAAAQRQLDELFERVSARSGMGTAAAANAPAVVSQASADHSFVAAEREELEHQLVELRLRRDVLLERRTPAHPDVVDIDERIAGISGRLAGIHAGPARRVVPAPTSANIAAAIDVDQETLASARAAYQQAAAELAAAGAAERVAHDALLQARLERRELISPAVVPQAPGAPPLVPWLLSVAASGLLLAWAASLCVRPATIRSPAEAQRVLRTAVVGVLPAAMLERSATSSLAA